MADSILLISMFIFSVVLAGLFAGAETGMYQLSRLRLRLGIEKKRLSFILLGSIMRNSPGLLLSMLTATNLFHYAATSILTYVFLQKMASEDNAELSATFITVPVLFIFSELIPKHLFFYRANSLMPYFSPVLFMFHRLFSWCGIVSVLKFISALFASLTGVGSPKIVLSTPQRHQVCAIIQDTTEEGLLSPVQVDLIDRLVNIPNVGIRSVMTAFNKVRMVDLNTDNAALLTVLSQFPYTRMLVYSGQPENITGFIDVYEALTSPSGFTNLEGFVKPVRRLPENMSVIDAIRTMQRERQKIVLVVRTGYSGREKPVGIVTMKDLAEELLGELSEW